MSFGKWTHINIFPDEVINLQREILHYHPELQEKLAKHGAHEWEVKLAQIAQHCEVILDGTYLEEDIINICAILEKKLMEMRKDNRGILILN